MTKGQIGYYIANTNELPQEAMIKDFGNENGISYVCFTNGVTIACPKLYDTYDECEKAITSSIAQRYGLNVGDTVYFQRVSCEGIHSGEIEKFFLGTHDSMKGQTYASIPVFDEEGVYDYTAEYPLDHLYRTKEECQACIDDFHAPARDKYREQISSPTELIQFMWEHIRDFEIPFKRAKGIYIDEDVLFVIKEKAAEFGIELHDNEEGI